MKTVLVTYNKFVDSGHALLDGKFITQSKVVEVKELTDVNDMFKNITKVKILSDCKEDLTRLMDEIEKVWNEDGDCGEIQLKTPIAWYRVLRIVNELRK